MIDHEPERLTILRFQWNLDRSILPRLLHDRPESSDRHGNRQAVGNLFTGQIPVHKLLNKLLHCRQPPAENLPFHCYYTANLKLIKVKTIEISERTGNGRHQRLLIARLTIVVNAVLVAALAGTFVIEGNRTGGGTGALCLQFLGTEAVVGSCRVLSPALDIENSISGTGNVHGCHSQRKLSINSRGLGWLPE